MTTDSIAYASRTSRRGLLAGAAAASAALATGILVDGRRAEATLGPNIQVGGGYTGDQTTEVGGAYGGPILNLWNSDVAGTADTQAVALTASVALDYALPPAGRSAAVFARNGRTTSLNTQYTCGVFGDAATTGGSGIHVGVLGEANGSGGTRVGVEGRSNVIGVRAFGDQIAMGAFSAASGGTGVVAVGDAYGVNATSSGGVAVRASSSVKALEVAGPSTFSETLTSQAGANFDGGITAQSFTGNGSGLTNVTPGPHQHNASDVNAGTLSDARLSTNVALKSAASNTFMGGLRAASYSGKGNGITDLSASNIASGTLADARLSRNIPRRSSKVVPFAGIVRAAQFSGPKGRPPVFSSLGTAQIQAGAKEITIRARGIGPGIHVLGLFQSNPGDGVALAHVQKLRTGFKAVLNAPAKRQATLAFFVLGQP